MSTWRSECICTFRLGSGVIFLAGVEGLGDFRSREPLFGCNNLDASLALFSSLVTEGWCLSRGREAVEDVCVCRWSYVFRGIKFALAYHSFRGGGCLYHWIWALWPFWTSTTLCWHMHFSRTLSLTILLESLWFHCNWMRSKTSSYIFNMLCGRVATHPLNNTVQCLPYFWLYHVKS